MKRLTLTIIATIIAALLLTGCQTEEPKTTAQASGEKLTERVFSQQSTAVPYPADKLKDSLERRNLRERLMRTNKPNAISYLYVLSFGEPLGFYTVKGKVSSTQSQMTTDQLQVCKDHKGDHNSSCIPAVVNAPGDDGSYGPNEDGIFFFTTEGTMVTTNLDYILSDQPLAFNVPELVQ